MPRAIDGMKVCSRADCDDAAVPQPIENFDATRNTTDGLSSWCRKCRAKYNKAVRTRDPSKVRSMLRKGREQLIYSRYTALGIKDTFVRSAVSIARKERVPMTVTRYDLRLPKNCPLDGKPLRIEKGLRGPRSPTLQRVYRNKGFVPGNLIIVAFENRSDGWHRSVHHDYWKEKGFRRVDLRKLAATVPDDFDIPQERQVAIADSVRSGMDALRESANELNAVLSRRYYGKNECERVVAIASKCHDVLSRVKSQMGKELKS